MRKSYKVALTLAIIVAVWLISGQIFPSSHDQAASNIPDIEAPTVRVRILEAVPKQLNITLNGVTESPRKVNLLARTEGVVEHIFVKEGDYLETGSAILQLAMDDRQERLQQARTTVEQRRLEYKVAKKLIQKKLQSETRLLQAQADLEQAITDLKSMELDMSYTKLTMPFAGIVDRINVEVGDVILVRDLDPLAVIIEQDPFLVTADISEQQVDKITLGSQGTARLVTGQIYTGTIRYISAIADPLTRTYQVELEIPNPDGELKEGTSAELILPTDKKLAFQIPSSALVLSDGGDIGVKVVNDQHRVEFYPVQVIDDDLGGIWVIGLPQTIRLITVGHTFVQDGANVIPVEESTSLSKENHHANRY